MKSWSSKNCVLELALSGGSLEKLYTLAKGRLGAKSRQNVYQNIVHTNIRSVTIALHLLKWLQDKLLTIITSYSNTSIPRTVSVPWEAFLLDEIPLVGMEFLWNTSISFPESVPLWRECPLKVPLIGVLLYLAQVVGPADCETAWLIYGTMKDFDSKVECRLRCLLFMDMRWWQVMEKSKSIFEFRDHCGHTHICRIKTPAGWEKPIYSTMWWPWTSPIGLEHANYLSFWSSQRYLCRCQIMKT